MIEILAASIIGLLALTIFMFVRKLRKPKPMDEIKLQKIHVMRLGPFSGQSNSFKGKSVVFMMLLSTLSYAEVDIVTLDNFFIDDLRKILSVKIMYPPISISEATFLKFKAMIRLSLSQNSLIQF